MDRSKIIGFALGPIITAILGLASLPILAWYFSTEDIGRISMLQVVISFTVISFSLGLDQSYVREYHQVKNKAVLLKTATLPSLLLFCLVSLGFFLYSPSLLSVLLFSIDSTIFSVLIVVCLLVSLLSRFLSLMLRMQEKSLAFSMSQVLPKLLFLLVIGGYVLTDTALNFSKLFFAQVSSVITIFFIYAWNTRVEWIPAIVEVIDYSELKKMFFFGVPLIFGGVASWGLMTMDRVFLRHLSSFDELGVYSVAASIAAAASVASSIFTTVWAPTVFKWSAAGEDLDKIDQVSEHVLAAVYFILCLGGMFSWLIAYILPPAYVSVQYLVVGCMIAPLFYMISEVSSVGIAISRKTGYSLIAACIAAGVNVLGNYLLIPMYGAIGATVSTALAFWIFILCRIEFSCLVWRAVPRLKVYVMTFVCLCAAASFAFLGEGRKMEFLIVWSILFFSGLFIFNNSIALIKRLIRFEYAKLKV